MLVGTYANCHPVFTYFESQLLTAVCNCAVVRLESELRAAQHKHPDIIIGAPVANTAAAAAAAAGSAEISKDIPPWVANSRYMAPLLVAYESHIAELVDKVDEQRVSVC